MQLHIRPECLVQGNLNVYDRIRQTDLFLHLQGRKLGEKGVNSKAIHRNCSFRDCGMHCGLWHCVYVTPSELTFIPSEISLPSKQQTS